MHIALDRFCLIFLFAIPIAVMLSTFTGAGRCVWLIYVSVLLIGIFSCAFKKEEAISHSAADDILCFSVLHRMWMALFILVFSGWIAFLLKKKIFPLYFLFWALRDTIHRCAHEASFYWHSTRVLHRDAWIGILLIFLVYSLCGLFLWIYQ